MQKRENLKLILLGQSSESGTSLSEWNSACVCVFMLLGKDIRYGDFEELVQSLSYFLFPFMSYLVFLCLRVIHILSH